MPSGIGVGDIFLNLKVNDKGLNTQLNGIGKLAKKAGKAMAAAFAVKELVQFGKACIDLGSDLAEVQNVVGVAFPTMSKQIDSFAADAAKNFGVSETMAKRFSGTFGSMATAFGFTEGEAATMATTLTGLAGDIASFYNISQDEAYTKLKSVFTGETEALKDLGVVMTQTALDSFALANGFGKTTKSMTEAEKVALRYSFVQDKLSNAAGDFARTSDSWANQVRILSLQFDTLKASIGEGLINILKPVVQWLNKVIERLITAAKAFAEFTKIFAKKDNDKLTRNLDEANASADNLNSAATAVSDSFSSATTNAKELKRTLAGFDQITKVDAETDSSTGGSVALGGIVDEIPSAMDTVEEETETRIKNLGEKLKTILTKTITSMAPALSTLLGGDNLAGGIIDVFTYIFKPFIDNADKLKDVLSKAGELLGSIFGITGSFVDKLKGSSKNYEDSAVHKFFTKATDQRTERIGGILDGISTALDTVLRFLSGETKLNAALQFVFDIIAGKKPDTAAIKASFTAKVSEGFTKAKKAFENLKSNKAIKTISGKVSDYFKNTRNHFNKLKSNKAVKTISGKVSEYFKNTRNHFNKLKSNKAIKTISGKISDYFKNTRKAFKDLKDGTAIKTIKGSISDYFKNSLAPAWNAISSHSVTKTITGVISGAFDTIRSAWESIGDKAATISLSFSAAMSDVKGWINSNIISPAESALRNVPFLSNVTLPRLAQGGYVKANTPQLAVIGDNRRYGEYVLPENKLLGIAQLAASLAGSGGGRDAEIVSLLTQLLKAIQGLNLSATVDVVALKKLIVRLINEHTQSTGVCEIYV